MSYAESLQITLDSLKPEQVTSSRPLNRLCICISDLHFTDATVGNQSAEETAWKDFFDEVISTCQEDEIDELTLLLAGDVVDMIRTGVWAKRGIYPWQREHVEYPAALHEIMQGIIRVHVQSHVNANHSGDCGFFHYLRQLPGKLPNVKVETLALLGNHDKELMTDPEVLRLFYEQCLGQPVASLSEAYRRWIGKMYGDELLFLEPASVPWLPFYWGDADLRLFVTHAMAGQRQLPGDRVGRQPSFLASCRWLAYRCLAKVELSAIH